MNDTGSFVAAVLRELAASTAVILAAWGALGGATNALTTKMRLRDALRHILLGGLIAAGMGSLSMAVITAWLGLPPETIPAGGAAGSAAYLVGLIHDLGYLVQEVEKAGSLAKAVASAVANRLPLEKAEEKEWETDHARQAVELLTLWHAPANVIQIIGEHHQANVDPNSLAAFVAGAELVARHAGIAERVHAGGANPFASLAIESPALAAALAQRLALKPEQVGVIAKRIVDQVEDFRDAARALAGKR